MRNPPLTKLLLSAACQPFFFRITLTSLKTEKTWKKKHLKKFKKT